MEDYKNILNLAVDNKLPEQIDESSVISVQTVRELIDSGYLSAINVTSLDEIAYLQPKITLPGREYLNKLIEKKPNMQSTIRLFISHSSNDKEFVKLLVELIKAALNLSSREIRCTSIDGYRLKAGAETDVVLKKEVIESDSFIGVISSNSNNSMYVAFELGARWGANLSLIPILTPGTSTNILKGPLTGLNALKGDEINQIHQLISDLAEELEVNCEPQSIYKDNITRILEFKVENNEESIEEVAVKQVEIDFSDYEISILRLISESSTRYIEKSHIVTSLPEKMTTIEYYLNKLTENKLLSPHLNMSSPTRYYLSEKGKAYLVENNLV